MVWFKILIQQTRLTALEILIKFKYEEVKEGSEVVPIRMDEKEKVESGALEAGAGEGQTQVREGSWGQEVEAIENDCGIEVWKIREG